MWSGMPAPRVMALFFVLPVLFFQYYPVNLRISHSTTEGEAAYFRPPPSGTSVPLTLPSASRSLTGPLRPERVDSGHRSAAPSARTPEGQQARRAMPISTKALIATCMR